MDASTQLDALADPTRRKIFEMLTQHPDAVGSLAGRLPVSRPAVSQHLKVLADAGLVTATKDGTRRVYAANPAGLKELSAWLGRLWEDVLDRFEAAAREEYQQMETKKIPAVVKKRTVPLEVEEAFRLFTEKIDTWWPLDGFSIAADSGKPPPPAVRFEGRVGGRIVEIGEDGEECAWADVLAWQPPERFMVAWHPNPEPVAASILEVRFTAVVGGTELHLEHRAWEEFGDQGESRRSGYEGGWDTVLAPYIKAAQAHQ